MVLLFLLKHLTEIYYEFMSLILTMSVLPDGYAGGLLLWLPQFEPADGSSPMREMTAHEV